MEPSISVDELQAEINKTLPPEQQIYKNDPLFAAIVLNKVALSAHVRSIQRKLDEAVQQMVAASEKQTEKSILISQNVTIRANAHIEKHLHEATKTLEESLHRSIAKCETTLARAYRLAWVGGVLVFVSGCIITGSFVGNFVFEFLHHANQRHR